MALTTTREHTDDVEGHILPLIALGVGLLVAGCEVNKTTIVNINVGSPGSTQTNSNGSGQAPPPR